MFFKDSCRQLPKTVRVIRNRKPYFLNESGGFWHERKLRTRQKHEGSTKSAAQTAAEVPAVSAGGCGRSGKERDAYGSDKQIF